MCGTVHRQKSFSIFVSSARMSFTKISLGGNNLYMMSLSLFPPRESLVSDISAGDGNIEKLILWCISRSGGNKDMLSIWADQLRRCFWALDYREKKTECRSAGYHWLFTAVHMEPSYILLILLHIFNLWTNQLYCSDHLDPIFYRERISQQ
jgi:hypothetical protein